MMSPEVARIVPDPSPSRFHGLAAVEWKISVLPLVASIVPLLVRPLDTSTQLVPSRPVRELLGSIVSCAVSSVPADIVTAAPSAKST